MAARQRAELYPKGTRRPAGRGYGITQLGFDCRVEFGQILRLSPLAFFAAIGGGGHEVVPWNWGESTDVRRVVSSLHGLFTHCFYGFTRRRDSYPFLDRTHGVGTRRQDRRCLRGP